MSIVSFQIDDNKRKELETIASHEGKTVGKIVVELIENYLNKYEDKIQYVSEKKHLDQIMKVSEKSFMEWDNDVDEIYNNL